MTTFRCPSDIFITSWLFTAWWSTWPGNHLVPCVVELVGSCIPIHAHRCLPDPKCLLYIHLVCRCASLLTTFALSQSMTWFSSTAWSVMAWLVSYTALPCPGGSGLCTSCESVHFFLVFQESCMNRDAGSYQLNHQVISRSRAPSSCKQSRHDQDVRRTSKRCH